jgi:hypothetical protein
MQLLVFGKSNDLEFDQKVYKNTNIYDIIKFIIKYIL